MWQELNTHREIAAYQPGLASLAERVRKVVLHFSISGIEWGETEAILLYQEVEVDYLLIDDRKAREKAELLGSVAWGRWVCSIWHGSAEWLMPYALCFQRCCRTAVTTLKPI